MTAWGNNIKHTIQARTTKKKGYKENSHLSPVSLSLLHWLFNHFCRPMKIIEYLVLFLYLIYFLYIILPQPHLNPHTHKALGTFLRIATTKMVTIVMIITILVYCYEGQRERISEPRFKPTRTTSLQGAPYQEGSFTPPPLVMLWDETNNKHPQKEYAIRITEHDYHTSSCLARLKRWHIKSTCTYFHIEKNLRCIQRQLSLKDLRTRAGW